MIHSLLLLGLCALRIAAVPTLDEFHESLTLHPLPDGKLSVLFEFTTYFSGPLGQKRTPESHHSLTSPALLLPLQLNNVSELSISFVSGQWDQHRSGQAGPLSYGSGGGGGETRGWLRNTGGMDEKQVYENWVAVTNALGGLFCATLAPANEGEVITTFGEIYPPARESKHNLTHFHVPHPEQLLCTENLTPFLALLPSKGISGLSALLAQPGVVLSWGFKAEGIDVVMPDPSTGARGQWKGWWEGVVDLVPVTGGSRASSIEKLFRKSLPRVFPEASSSVIRLITPAEEAFRVDPLPRSNQEVWIDGKQREVLEWDLMNGDMVGKDLRFWWHEAGDFKHPIKLESPPISISRRMAAPFASDGTFVIRITNAGDESRQAVYSEVWPWWVKGWMSEVTIVQEGLGQERASPHLLTNLAYHPSRPPNPSTTSLHFTLTLPAQSTLVLSIPYSKLTIKYTEHRPDAERGVELSSGVLTLLDLEGEDISLSNTSDSAHLRRSGRSHIYTTRLLLDLPTPDFSMPYNVIMMSCTVMTVFFGMMQGALSRRWGYIDTSVEDTSSPIGKIRALLKKKLGRAVSKAVLKPVSAKNVEPILVPESASADKDDRG